MPVRYAMFKASKPFILIRPAQSNDSQVLQGTQSPPSPSKKQATGQNSHPKLRLSCDACAVAKVKCGRERPRCTRCAVNGAACLYKSSLRHGKPKKKNLNREHQATQPAFEGNGILTPQRSGASTSGSEYDFCGDLQKSLADHIQNGGSSADMSVAHQESSRNHDVLSEKMSPMSSFSTFDDPLQQKPLIGSRGDTPSGETFSQSPSSQDMSNNLSNPFNLSASKHSNWDFSCVIDQDVSLAANTIPSNSASQPEDPVGRPFEHEVSPSQMCDCYAVANSTLASLHLKPDPPSRGGSFLSLLAASCSPSSIFSYSCSPVQIFEDPFPINQEAIKTVSQLLKCPCAGDQHMAMLYASIIVKVLYRYQVAAGMEYSEPYTCGSAKSIHTSAWSLDSFIHLSGIIWPFGQASPSRRSYDGAFFAREPFRIGIYTPDEEDQESIRRLLLLSGLGKVGRLIEALAKIGDGFDEGASNLYGTLGTWLNSELSRTIKKGGDGVEGAVAP